MSIAAADPDPSDWIRRLRAGDDAAFEELFVRTREAVWATAYRVLRDADAADEATQRTFVRAWKAIDGFRGEATVKTWITRIAFNVARSMWRREPPAESLDLAPEPVDAEPDGELRAMTEDARKRVRWAVSRLAPRQREVVTLKAFGGLTYDETAHAMGLTVGAVKAHFHQAVSNLRRRLNERAKGERAS